MDVLFVGLVVILVLLLVGSAPYYSYNRNWGYRPMGAVGILLATLVLFFLLGRP